jgi:hypothetical protein
MNVNECDALKPLYRFSNLTSLTTFICSPALMSQAIDMEPEPHAKASRVIRHRRTEALRRQRIQAAVQGFRDILVSHGMFSLTIYHNL